MFKEKEGVHYNWNIVKQGQRSMKGTQRSKWEPYTLGPCRPL